MPGYDIASIIERRLRQRMCWRGPAGFKFEQLPHDQVRITYDNCSAVYPLAQLDAYLNKGVKIQCAMPNRSADDREFVMTGLTPLTFPAEPDDDDDDDDDE